MNKLEKRAFVEGFLRKVAVDPMFKQVGATQPIPPVNPTTPALSKAMPAQLPTAQAERASQTQAPMGGGMNPDAVKQVIQKFFRNRVGSPGQPFNPGMQPNMAGRVAPSIEQQQTINSTERSAGGDAIPNAGAVP